MEIILFLAGLFAATYLVGMLLHKVKVPWIFAPLLLGLILAIKNPFFEITGSPVFLFLAQFGMFLMLFSIGFQLDLKKMVKSSKFIIRTTSIIILSEAVVASFLIHYIFGLGWLVSFLLSLSFATIGEAILLPILDEFNLTKTKFGQTILSIGVVDDIFEVLTIVLVSMIFGYSLNQTSADTITNIAILGSMFLVSFLAVKFSSKIRLDKLKSNSLVFLILMVVFTAFIGLGSIVHAAALGALLSGIIARAIIPKEFEKKIGSQIKVMTYGLFAPIFFLWVGLDVDISQILANPLLIVLFTVVTYLVKALSSYISTRKELGSKKAILLGISLCVRLSTSIVLIKLLLEKGIIDSQIYSILIGTQLVFKFVIPVILSILITRWKISPRSKS